MAIIMSSLNFAKEAVFKNISLKIKEKYQFK